MAFFANSQHHIKNLLSWALLLGIGLIIMQYLSNNLPNNTSYNGLIWPLYALILSLPFSMMLLAEQPQKQAFKFSLGFSAIAVICAAFMGYASVTHHLASNYNQFGYITTGLSALVAWFIYIAFAEHACVYKTWYSHYESLFDFSWRNAVKLITASIFTGLFWLALFFLVFLFKTININFFETLVQNASFVYMATSLAFGIGLAMYVANQQALSEFKHAILQVMGYLLPMVSLILLSFMLVLPFKGLNTFWVRGYDTGLGIMLGLMSLMVFLVNAAFQDGRTAKYPDFLLKLSNIALIIMPIYALICAYGLSLRIHDFGWTVKRVWAASWIAIMVVYAFGYARAALQSFAVKPIHNKLMPYQFSSINWLQGIKMVNVFAAMGAITLLALLNSPILNPTRIGVQSQVAQLLTGRITTVDFNYLRFEAGRYGNEALLSLKASKNSDLSAQASAVLNASDYAYVQTPQQTKLNSVDAFAAKFTVYPQSQQLPKVFYEMLVSEQKKGNLFLDCLNDLTKKQEKCRALLIDLNNDQKDEVIIFNPYGNRFFAQKNGVWTYVGDVRVIDYGADLPMDDEAVLASGKYQVITPEWQQLQFGSQHWQIEKK